MKKKLKVASVMLYVVSAGALFWGLVYLFTPTIMPYHERFLGMAHEQLEPKVALLFLALIRVAGAAFLSIGIALVMLVTGPFSRGDKWTWWIILVMALLTLIPLLFITLNIGLYTPWWAVGVMIILVIAAMVISKSPSSSK